MAKKNKSKPSVIENARIKEELNVMNGLMAVVSGLGYGVPPGQESLSQTDTLFKNNRWYLISNFRQLLSELYAEFALCKNFVNVPVDDALSKGYGIKSKQLNEEQVSELTRYVKRENINQTYAQSAKWNRLFGGSGILLITDQDSSKPIDVNALMKSKRIKFRAVDMWELFFSKQNIEDTKSQLDTDPELPFNYYGQQIDRSRVMLMKGYEAPSFLRPRLRGWGLSILEDVVRSVNQYMKSNNLVFEVLDEFKLDVYKIKNFNQALATSRGSDQVTKRLQLANMVKSFQNSIVMDSEDGYDSKSLSFAGIPEMMKEFRVQIASDLRIPMTKLFGISASGFNAGEDDIENYNAMIQSEIRSKMEFDILKMLEICCAVLFDFVPDDLEIEWPSLRVLSDEQEEAIKGQKLNRVMMAFEKGLLSVKQTVEAINKENLLPVKIDESEVELPEEKEETDEKPEKE